MCAGSFKNYAIFSYSINQQPIWFNVTFSATHKLTKQFMVSIFF